MQRTFDERKHIVKQYWKTGNTMDVIRTWPHYFPSNPPNRKKIFSLCNKFEATRSVTDALRSARPKSVTNKENKLAVAQFFVENPTTISRDLKDVS